MSPLAYDEMALPDGSVRPHYRPFADWLAKTPDGKAVVYYRKEPYDGPGKVELSQPYRGGYAAIVGSGR